MEVFTRSGRRERLDRRARLFTLEHANRALPLVKRIVADIVKQYKKVSALEEECEVAGAADESMDLTRDRYGAELERLRELAEELQSIGCELKDWRRGLVDFPAVHQGRQIYLCWRLGENDVHHWHERDAGYHGRQPVDETFIPLTCDPSIRERPV